MIKGGKFFELQLGVKEVSTYLLIGQAVFQFLNDMTIMQAEVDRHARAKISEAKKHLFAKREMQLTGKQALD